MSTQSKEITVGGREFTVQRFRGLKAILAIASVTRIAREVPDILAKAMKDYSKRNTITLTPEVAKLPRWQGAGFTEDDFESHGGEIELPAQMSGEEQVMAALPDLLEQARKEVIRLLSILIVPNADLAEADKRDEVDKLLAEHHDLLLYEAELDELAELALAAGDVVSDQLASKKDRLGKLLRSVMALWSRQFRNQTEESQLAKAAQSIVEETEEASTQRTSPDELPTSSTPSPPPTDGAGSEPSTVSPGAS